MTDNFARLLDLLSALQAKPAWSGPKLAARLGVTVRTVRRDIDRLRSVGYAVESDAGVHGGYHLGLGGTAVPPLLLDDDEILALALCVRAAAGDSVVGIGDAAGRALAKLEHTMPQRLRRRLEQVTTATHRLPARGDEVDAGVLVTVSRACRYRERIRVSYRNHHCEASSRRIEPYRIVNAGRRWYLVALDTNAGDWRTFRLDRIISAEQTGEVFERADPPDPVDFVQHSITTAPYAHRAVVELDASLAVLAAKVPPTIGTLEVVDDSTTMLTAGANDLDYLALSIARLGVPFRVREPDELRERIGDLAHRLASAAAGSFA